QQQKDDFLGIASHELKTPVTTIKAYSHLLQEILLQKGDIKEASLVTKMGTQVNRLTNLIADLLDVTKINAGKLQLNNTRFEFNTLVKDIVEDIQNTVPKINIQKDFNQTGIVYVDKERIVQVITNLITNAIKYSPGTNKIIVHTSVKNKEIILSVQDFGVGIPASHQLKVFEKFYRVSGDMQHTFPGLGLGLYISSEIIKRVGGRIWVNSVEGEGATFCFALPVLDDGTENL
ncbi:MAG: HAMP domain-containing histidine kinase, partial [Ferruginibacter sp.]|nr:HAMP domain-containing histidine kinase [Ferruginibacter sp.]